MVNSPSILTTRAASLRRQFVVSLQVTGVVGGFPRPWVDPSCGFFTTNNTVDRTDARRLVQISRRQMGSSLNLEDLLEQSPKDIFQQGASEQRCISGRFKMSWNLPNNKIEVLASVSPPNLIGRDEHTFHIFFQSDAEYIKMLDFAPNDEFRLSLKGVEVKKLSNIPKLSTLPMQLVFSKGLHIAWKRQGPNEARKTINTWSCMPNSFSGIIGY